MLKLIRIAEHGYDKPTVINFVVDGKTFASVVSTNKTEKKVRAGQGGKTSPKKDAR